MSEETPEKKSVTAALLIIGNEVLSGRTQDANLKFLGENLNDIGIQIREARIVADVEDGIIEALNALRARYDYVFTTGGIGPTHDDITSAAIAKAFGLKLVRHPEAEAILRAHYKPEDVTEERLKMAEMPEGATLIENPVSKAPGYRVENVIVMAGIPRIMQGMFEGFRHRLRGGVTVGSRSIAVSIPEGIAAKSLGKIQEDFPDVEIGSYPFVRHGETGTCLVARSSDPARLDAAADAIEAMVRDLGAEPEGL